MLGLPQTNHDATPEQALTITQAHRIMQSHRHCPVSICAAKARTKRVLVAAGKLVPADAPHMGS